MQLRIASLSTAVLPVVLFFASSASGGDSDGCCMSGVRLNELRVAHPGLPQNNEYVELTAQPGASLDCMFYIVLGPGGVVEELVGLSGSVVGPSGYFLIAQPGFDPSTFPGMPTPDLVTPLNLIDNGNRTHLLVCDCAGLPGIDEDVDLDSDDDGVLDCVCPLWDCVVDCIALVQTPGAPPVYCPIRRGPTPAGNAPSHVYRCSIPGSATRPWRIGVPPLPPTGVDSPGQANPACVTGPIFAGLLHEPLGQAELALVDDTLVVSALGNTPGNGVAIDLGSADALCLFHELAGLLTDPDCGTPNAGSITVRAFDLDSQPALVATYSCVGPGQLGLEVSFGPGSAMFDVILRLGGNEVASAKGLVPQPGGGPPIVIEWQDILGNQCEIRSDLIHLPDDVPGDVGWTGTTGTPQQAEIVGTNIAPVLADEIIVRPTIPKAPPGISRVEVTASGFGPLVITGEALRAFGNPHEAAGESLMLGASGQDGYGIEFRAIDPQSAGPVGTLIEHPYGPTDVPGVEIIGIIVKPEHVGQFFDDFEWWIQPRIVGIGGGGDEMALGSLKISGARGGTEFAADFTPLGATELLWQGFNKGELVGTVPAPGPMATLFVPGTPFDLFIYKIQIVTTGSLKYLYIRKCYLFNFVVPIFGGFVDEIGVCVALPPVYVPQNFVMRLGLSGTNFEGFRLVEEAPILAKVNLCPADLDGDGQVGGADLGELLANWSMPGPSDLDGSGATDGGDLGALLADWGDCP